MKWENKFSFLNILVKYDSMFYINKKRLLYKESLWTIYYTSSVFFVSFPNTKTDIAPIKTEIQKIIKMVEIDTC